MRVLICGAGIAGLTTALGLRRWGHRPVIIERAAWLRDAGYMIDFFGPGYEVAERMRLVPALETIHYPIGRLAFAGASGVPHLVIRYAAVRKRLFGGRHFNFMRGDLEHLLFDRLRGEADVRFGTTIDVIAPDDAAVGVSFSDGTTERFDVVIGADGVHSRVRELVFGPEQGFVRPLGCVATTFIAAPPVLAARLEDTLLMQSEPGRQVSAYPIRGGRIAAFFLGRSSHAADAACGGDCCDALRVEFAGLRGIVPTLIDACGSAGAPFHDGVVQIEMPAWSAAGRVALVGDAAWCVSLLAGQGASLAMAGGYILARELARTPDDIRGALQRYQARLGARVRRRQRAGRRMARWFLPETRYGIRFRDALTRASLLPGMSALVRHNFEPTTTWLE